MPTYQGEYCHGSDTDTCIVCCLYWLGLVAICSGMGATDLKDTCHVHQFSPLVLPGYCSQAKTPVYLECITSGEQELYHIAFIFITLCTCLNFDFYCAYMHGPAWCLPVISQRLTQDPVSPCNHRGRAENLHIPCLRVAPLKSPFHRLCVPRAQQVSVDFSRCHPQTRDVTNSVSRKNTNTTVRNIFLVKE